MSTSDPVPAQLGAPPSSLLALLAAPQRRDRLTHVEHIPSREGRHAPWPAWIPDLLQRRLRDAGTHAPWDHQARAAEAAWAGRSVIVATGTASGKSLAYLMPSITATLDGATTLYLSPTKALAADQLSSIRAFRLAGVRAATFDGDTPTEEREWVRAHANYVLTNPDMLHRSMLPRHGRWASFFRQLRYVVIDECHGYRGVFGSHVAALLRRLRRVCARYGAEPTFILASATVSGAGEFAHRLTGVTAEEITEDASPAGATEFALWEPQLTSLTGEQGAPVRRTATAEAADLLADLVASGVSTLVFARSRRGAEAVSLSAQRALTDSRGGTADDTAVSGAGVVRGSPIAAYRAGYLPEERRELERALRSGELTGLAATNALELGIDVSGLDAVLLAGWPGTRASMWQQAGRAGRSGQGALAVLVARDDPLDTYLVHHPDALFGLPVEAAVLDPDNPHVLRPHLCAAAAELPLTDSDVPMFGAQAAALLDDLTSEGTLRRRPSGWYWTRRDRASDLADIRGGGGPPVHLVESDTGRLLGTVDEPAAHSTAHAGAVYLHQGETYLVRQLDLEDRVAFLAPADPDYVTSARDVTEVRIQHTERSSDWGTATLGFGSVEVSRQVVSYLRRRVQTGEVLGEEPLEMPVRTLETRAVWWTLPHRALPGHPGATGFDPGGAAHAAEHASIGLLPLFATCDRWDIGGVSTAEHPDTGELTVFVYDGYDGGAGFAARGYDKATEWLTATRAAVAVCECEAGCPSCIQSPKCGNGNEPLDKRGAVHLLDAILGYPGRTAG